MIYTIKKIYRKVKSIKNKLFLVKRKIVIKLFKNNDYKVIKNSKLFNYNWYRKVYKLNKNEDAVSHYLNIGWKKGNNPSKKFSTINYFLLRRDIKQLNINPLVHYEKYGKYENYQSKKNRKDDYVSVKELKNIKQLQNTRIKEQYSTDINKLIAFIVPELDFIGGGVMSICSIANITKENRKIHNSDVILVTTPREKTFTNYTNFKTDFDIFRFEQLIDHFKNLEELIIHIPETYIIPFLYFISPLESNWIRSIKKVTVNILNQNIELMPRPEDTELLRLIVPNLTMTCAHKRYCVSQLRTSYNMPIHWLSTSNMTNYYYKTYSDKKNILVYSPDYHPLKERIIDKIKKEIPYLELIMINNMSYEEYKKIISDAKWMITFGEGLDGYFIESIRSGSISFAVYNNSFFNENFVDLPNVYSSYNDMLEKIVDDIKTLDSQKIFKSLNEKIIEIDQKEYDDSVYIDNIIKYYKKEYTFPMTDIIKKRKERMKSNPLISVVLATYNGESFLEKQLKSLANLSYKNKEIIISDDYSTDDTMKIIEKFIKNFKGCNVIFVRNEGKKGLNANFTNAINHAKGEYIALCDQDDIWEPNKLELLLEHIDEFDVIHGKVIVIDDTDSYYPQPFMHIAYENDKTKYYHFADYVNENFVLGCTTLIRKELIDKILPIPTNAIYHDWWIMINAILKGKGICYIDKKVINYRQHQTNTAKKTYNNPDWFEKKQLFDKLILETFPNMSEKDRLKVELDLNYSKIRDVFSRYIFNDIDDFFDKNKDYFSKEFMNVLINKILDKK